jgi:hypothetical protein
MIAAHYQSVIAIADCDRVVGSSGDGDNVVAATCRDGVCGTASHRQIVGAVPDRDRVLRAATDVDGVVAVANRDDGVLTGSYCFRGHA